MGIRVLVVDNDPVSVDRLLPVLKAEGYTVIDFEDRNDALDELGRREYDVVVAELDARAEKEVAFLGRARDISPGTEVIIVSSNGTIDTAVAAMKMGAFHFLPKPYKIDDLVLFVRRAVERRVLQLEVEALRAMVRDKRLPPLIGKSLGMQKVRRDMARVAPLDCTVLIRGETGTGKELVSRTIHLMSTRADKQFFAINAGAFNPDLLANELFGHEKEAYTGAQGIKKGIFESIAGGTLLLDEIGEMSGNMQVQLLRALQERTIVRVGGTREIPVDLRILAATNRNLEEDIERGSFRRDLFYRLNVFSITLPPLRERSEDIPLFCQYFLDVYSRKFKKKVRKVSKEVLELFMEYPFPGNVRELENVIERAIVLCDGHNVEVQHLPRRFRKKREGQGGKHARLVTLAEMERQYIFDVLDRVQGNKAEAAKILGIDRATLWRKLKRYQEG